MLGQWLKAWTAHLQSRGYSPRTVELYTAMAGEFVRFIPVCRSEDILPAHLRDYRIHVHNQDISRSTHIRKISAARDFTRYLFRSSLTLVNPDAHLDVPVSGQHLPQTVPGEKDVRRILDYLRRRRPVRRRAIIDLFYSTGIRRSELMNLNLYDIDFSEGTLLVRSGKGKRDRLLPVPGPTLSVLRSWLDERTKRCRASRALFIKRNGGRIDNTAIDNIFRGLNQTLELTPPVSPHVLRHAIATHLLRRGVDIRFIQVFLGHSRIHSTEIYTRVIRDHLREEIDRHHPRNRMRGLNP